MVLADQRTCPPSLCSFITLITYLFFPVTLRLSCLPLACITLTYPSRHPIAARVLVYQQWGLRSPTGRGWRNEERRVQGKVDKEVFWCSGDFFVQGQGDRGRWIGIGVGCGRDGARRKKDETGTRPVKLEKMSCLLSGRDRKFVA